jgi:hypothetical protein
MATPVEAAEQTIREALDRLHREAMSFGKAICGETQISPLAQVTRLVGDKMSRVALEYYIEVQKAKDIIDAGKSTKQ